MDLFKQLAEPFPPSQISWRVGSTTKDKTAGLALAFIDARDVMDRLDEVVGAENWQDRYEVSDKRVFCVLSIRVNGEWITKSDAAGDTAVEGEKGAVSDALKRAAVKFGVGRYLYHLGSTWVDLEPAGNSYRIKDGQTEKLAKSLPSPNRKATAERWAENAPKFVDALKKYPDIYGELKAKLEAVL